MVEQLENVLKTIKYLNNKLPESIVDDKILEDQQNNIEKLKAALLEFEPIFNDFEKYKAAKNVEEIIDLLKVLYYQYAKLIQIFDDFEGFIYEFGFQYREKKQLNQ